MDDPPPWPSPARGEGKKKGKRMGKHLQKDLDRLKKDILGMGGMVEASLTEVLKAFFERKAEPAEGVIEKDEQIDRKENEIEEECLKVLALHQPVAIDLRFIITVLKVNNDLERMGDYCVNIAERTRFLATREPLELPPDFRKGAQIAQKMVRQSLDALVYQDTARARQVLESDPTVDAIHQEMFSTLEGVMEKNPGLVRCAVPTLSVFRYLERIADLATNIAEDTIFMVEGEIVRHMGL